MLEVRDLSVSYGQHRALAGASVRVGKGEIVVILGANGAGKSTLLKAVSGICEGKVAGSVQMDGIDISAMAPDRIVEEGIALVPEGRGIFGDLSVHDNLILGAYPKRARDEEAAHLEQVFTLFPRLRERLRQTVRTMSGGEQQMVAIGRAMMSNPAILTLDEPSLGLSPLLCKDLFQSLKVVRQAGIGILLVEQNAKQSLAIADRGYLLENGQIVHEDTAEKLMKDPAVQKAYLGGGGAAAPITHRGKGPGPKPPVPQPAATRPRPAGPSPSDIAAAALQNFAQPASAKPTPAPAPKAPPPRPVAQPAPPPAPPTTSAAPGPHGIDVAGMVARASARSAEPRPNGAAPKPAPRPAIPPRPPIPEVRMPDLGESADRLRSVLAEIEEAAARARDYRPKGRKP
ncbi:MAG: ABC transporter ATP-binding protein [Rhodobacteraceae bacterium]|nr:ABC transporter ATP-binding protein [Paracoccaceae bacterium]